MPQNLIEDLGKMVDSSSKTGAVILAIQEEIKRRKLARIRTLAGSIHMSPSAKKGRHHDHRLR